MFDHFYRITSTLYSSQFTKVQCMALYFAAVSQSTVGDWTYNLCVPGQGRIQDLLKGGLICIKVCVWGGGGSLC